MDRQQPVRHRSRQPIRQQGNLPKVSGSSVMKKAYLPLQLVVWLLQRHTSLIWLATWAILVGTAAAAVMFIVDPDASVQWSTEPVYSTADLESETNSPLPSEPQSSIPANSELIPAPLPEFTQPQPKPQTNQRPEAVSPLSAIGPILFSCAAGCFLLSQWLKPQPPIKAVKRSKPGKIPSQRPHLKQSVSCSTDTIAPKPDLLLLPAATQHLPVANYSSYQTAEPQSTENSTSEAVVSVVPADQSHPLDWDEPSLADSLDLRQRRPLSYWL